MNDQKSFCVTMQTKQNKTTTGKKKDSFNKKTFIRWKFISAQVEMNVSISGLKSQNLSIPYNE